MDNMTSLKERILALPTEEQETRRAYYSKEEWETSWALHARPFQVAPLGEWKVWSIYSPPGFGSTRAGAEWVADTLLENKGKPVTVLVYCGYPARMDKIRQEITGALLNRGVTDIRTAPVGTSIGLILPWVASVRFTRDTSDPIRGVRADYVWGDSVLRAGDIVQNHPQAERFVFSDPARPANHTLVSRAGDPRI